MWRLNGPQSKECIQFIIDNNYEMTLGNHEIMFIEYFLMKQQNKVNFNEQVFLKNGGDSTLESYNYDYNTQKFKSLEDEDILEQHLNFLMKQPLIIKYILNDEPIYISHSLLNENMIETIENELPQKKIDNIVYFYPRQGFWDNINDFEIEETILWNRYILKHFLMNNHNIKYKSIFGHTMIKLYNKSNVVDTTKNFINLDTGMASQIKLSGLHLETNTIFEQPYEESK